MRLVHKTFVGSKCAVNIYRDVDIPGYIVRTLVGKKLRGEYETNDRDDARSTAAAEARWLKKQRGCRAPGGGLAGARRRRRR